jgi:DNA-binding Xre family transcriptional regulator
MSEMKYGMWLVKMIKLKMHSLLKLMRSKGLNAKNIQQWQTTKVSLVTLMVVTLKK